MDCHQWEQLPGIVNCKSDFTLQYVKMRATRADRLVDLHARNRRLDAENQALAERFSRLTEYNQVLGDDLANLDAEILYLEQLIETKTRKMDRLTEKVDALSKSIAGCRRKLAGDPHVSRMAQRLKRVEEMRISVLKKLRELRGDTFVDNLEEVKAGLNFEIEILEGQRQDLEEQKEVLEILADREASSAERKDVLEEILRQKEDERQRLLDVITRIKEDQVIPDEYNEEEDEIELHELQRQKLLEKDPESYSEMMRYMEDERPRSEKRISKEDRERPKSQRRHRREDDSSKDSERSERSSKKRKRTGDGTSSKTISKTSEDGKESRKHKKSKETESEKESRKHKKNEDEGIEKESRKARKRKETESEKESRKHKKSEDDESEKNSRKVKQSEDEASDKESRKHGSEDGSRKGRKSEDGGSENQIHSKPKDEDEKAESSEKKTEKLDADAVPRDTTENPEKIQTLPSREGVVDIETQANEEEIDPVVNIKAFEFSEQEKEALAKLEKLQAEIQAKEEEKRALQDRIAASRPKRRISTKSSITISPTPDAIKDLSLVVFERRSKGMETDVTGASLDFHMRLLDDQVAELTVASDLQDNVEKLRKQIRATNEKIEEAKEVAEDKDEQIKRIKDDLRAAKVNLEQEQTNEDLETRMKNHMLSEISQMKSSIMMMQDQIVGQNARTEAAEAKIKELTRVKRALERDIQDMAQREKPEVRSLSQEVGACQNRVVESKRNLELAEKEIQEKRKALEQLKNSEEMKHYRDLCIRRVKLERRLVKWKVLLKDSKETIQSLEVYSATNSQKRQALTEALEKAMRKKRKREEEIRELEHYSALLSALLREQNENWR